MLIYLLKNKFIHFSLLILLIVGFSDLYAQFWLRKGTGVQQSEALDISVDVAGNSYTTGSFFNSITFGAFNATASGLTDIYLVKTDSAGNFQWLVTAGGSGLDKGHSVKTDNFGNVYITGVFTGSANFGSTVITSSNSSQDIFLAKYNSSGVLQWVKKAGGNLGDASNSVTTDISGNIYITGFFEGVAQFESTTLTSAIHPVSSLYTPDIFTAKYDANGNLIWVEQGTTVEFATGIDLATDATGNIYVTGHFSGNITFDVLHPNNSFNAIFIVKYNSSGIEQWFTMMGAGTTNSVSGIASDISSNIYLTGNFTGGTIIFGTPNITLTNNHPERIFIVKLDSAGDVIWTQTAGSASSVSVNNIAVDNLNNPYLIGNFECKFSEYADQYGQGTFNSVGFKDVFVSKYDTSGNWQWSRQFGGQKNDLGNGISIDPNNHAVICGNFINSINFPVNPANFYSPIGDFIPSSINQNITYCGDSNYGSFAALQGNSLMNSFIAKPIDLSREPYDFHKRSGSGCNRDVGNICIASPDSICYQDSLILEGCDPVTPILFAFHSSGPGPEYTYSWNLSDSSSSIFPLFNAAAYIVTVTSFDGCLTLNDTLYYEKNIWPKPQITITNSFGITPTPPCELGYILICPPDSQVVLTASTNGISYHWVGPNIPPVSNLSITATVEGIYSFIATGANGCVDSFCVEIRIIPPLDPIIIDIDVPDTLYGCLGDTVHILAYPVPYTSSCVFLGEATWISTPSLSLTPHPTCLTKVILTFTQGGSFELTATVIRTHPCGASDTIVVTKSTYIVVNPSPPIPSVTISGDLLICPSENNTILTASGATTYEWYSLFNGALIDTSSTVTISQPAFYYLIATAINSFGCTSENVLIFEVKFKPIPVIQMNPPSGVICPGGTVQLAMPAPSGTWQWFGPAGAISGSVSNITVSTPGNYFCIYTDTDSCEFILNSVQVQQYSTPYLSAGPSNVLCPGETVTIEVITNAGSSVQWLPPLSGTDPIQIITQPGTYTAMITSCGIQTIDSVTILSSNVEATINPPGPIFVCQGDSLLLIANPGMATYTWNPGNITSQDLLINQSGLYELTTTDVYGCSATSSVEVYTYLLELPLALGDTVCKDSSTVLIGYFFGEGTIAWYDAPNGNFLDTGMYFTTPPLQSTTIFYMQAFDSVCVSEFEPVEVFVYPSPSAPIVSSNSPVCAGDTILLSTSFSLPGTIYNWSGPNNFSSGVQYPSITNASNLNSGIYQLIVTADECPSEPAQINVTVVTIPQTPNIYTNNSYCEGDTIIISSDAISGVNYSWTGPNNFTSSTQQNIITNASLVNAGNYYLSLSAGSCFSDTASFFINVLESPNSVNPFANSPLCIGDTLFLNSIFVNGYNYSWSGPNNFNSVNSSEFIFPVAINHSGNYILTVEENGCTGIPEIISVQVNELPLFTLGDDKTVCSGETVSIYPDEQFENYFWSTGYTGMELNTTEAGIFYLTVTDINNCHSTDSIFINFIDCFTNTPNIFTPNNDGYNDVFAINSNGMLELSCKIFNRWGELIYEFKNENDAWDGTNQNSGKPCPDGVYFYTGSSTDFSLTKKSLNGFIHLITK